MELADIALDGPRFERNRVPTCNKCSGINDLSDVGERLAETLPCLQLRIRTPEERSKFLACMAFPLITREISEKGRRLLAQAPNAFCLPGKLKAAK